MIKKLKLLSQNSKEYPDIVVDFKVVENVKDYVTKKLNETSIQVGQAQKTVPVKATKGVVGQQVDTRPHCMRDGKVYAFDETQNSVKVEGSMIVHNPDGEKYIVKPNDFSRKYEKAQGEDMYMPIGAPIDYIIIDEDITFKAPWGSDIYAPAGAALNITDLNNIYSITNLAFEKTYTPVLVDENNSNL